MKNDEYIKYRDEFIAEANSLSSKKSIEYTISNLDKHYNFKHVADRLGLTPQQAMMVYILKHIDALTNDAKTGKTQSDETVRSRCMDIANYAILYSSLHHETKGTDTNVHNTKSNRAVPSKNSGSRTEKSEPTKWEEFRRTRSR